MVKKYALIGTGGRAIFFYTAIVKDFPKTAQLVGFCDTNQTRLDYANSRLEALGHAPVPTFLASDFDRMIAETKPDDVIVTTIDRTHNIYIVRALELGCNVITEKPMTIDVPRCREIFSAVERTGKKVTVSFNYRYAPHNTKIYELLSSGAIGEVTSVHFEWLLNTQHGADYFRRWHRDKRNSGGLLVHKSTHHFDLVNFWLQSQPETVVAMGDLKFYGRENAEKRGETKFYSRAYGSDNAKDDHFALHLDRNPQLKAMYLDAEKEDAYYRDQSVFSDGISIEDTMGVMVRYRSGAVLTYSLTAYAPWEGFRVMFNGTKGRLEVEVVEQSYVNSGGEQALEGALESRSIVLRPLFGKPVDIEIPEGSGGHGGGDPQLLNDLFGEVSGDDPFRRAASHVDGALSILTGISANQSLRTGQTVRVDDVFQIIMKLPGTAVAMDSSRSYNDLSMAVDELVNACQEGNTTLVKALLDGGLSARFLRKALEKAILNNHPNIVKLLLERGVLDQCILSSEDEWPWLLEPADTTGSLQFAAMNGKTEVVTALLAWDIRLVNCVDSLERTALSFAVRGGHIETVRVLIAATADIMAVDAYGLTVLDHAREACNRDIVELLEAEIARVQA